MRILGIDPGTVDSAFVLWDTETHQILAYNSSYRDEKKDLVHKQKNEEVLGAVINRTNYDLLSCEMISGQGMPVGKETFVTVLWIGRYIQAAQMIGKKFCLVPRQTVKFNMCNSAKANDSTIRMALIDRYGQPGKKKSPGLTFPLHADMWQAFAVCITTEDLADKIEDVFIRW